MSDNMPDCEFAYGLKWVFADDREGSAPGADVSVRFLLKLPPMWSEDYFSIANESYSSRDYDVCDNPYLKLSWSRDREIIRFEYQWFGTFLISADGSQVWVCTERDRRDVRGTVLGPIAAYVLRLRGRVCLHACGLAHRGNAYLFCGPSGMGKSTLGAFLSLDGLSLICDDVAPLSVSEDSVQVLRGSTVFRLWPESLVQLGIDADQLERVVSTHEKRQLPAAETISATSQIDQFLLKSVFFLERGSTDQFEVQEVDLSHALRMLLEHASTAYVQGSRERGHRALEFRVLGALLRRVRCFRLITPRSLDMYAGECKTLAARVVRE